MHIQRNRARPYALALLVVLAGCGRVGLDLLPLPAAGTDAGANDAGAGDGGSSDAGMCADPGSSPTEGMCGCGIETSNDEDSDGVPDCMDFCPGMPDQRDATSCGCPAAEADADDDGVRNCFDRCPFDGMKSSPGLCGCGTSDDDDDRDNTPNCQDDCPDDPDKSEPGACGCGQSDRDTDLDGAPDCMDRCSGRTDDVYMPDGSCGVGYCRAHNAPSTCQQGMETACMAGEPLSTDDASCDGVDDDCDGRTDEAYPSTPSTCGNGVCAATGSIRCVAGEVVDSCSASAPGSTDDATCNGRDDDCDGRVDENVATTPSTCGMTACSTMGVIACVNGMPVDSCQATSPISPTDPTCDNVDDDCDGRIDEEFAPSMTSCGVGVCARMGMRTCTSGSAVDSCVPGMRTSTSDTSCNGLDDDCDGTADDDFVVSATSCGVGACMSSGSLRCVSGSTQNSCVAKTPATTVDDATSPGNGIDDDCDGQVDEDLPACDTSPRTYEAGAYDNISVPGACQHVSVRLWGGGGASGQNVAAAISGDGGAGGYATANVLISGAISLYVAGAAAANCNSAGTNAGSSSYNGGDGGSGDGAPGADGSASGGGTGAKPSPGYAGGDGHYGGGGGGEAAADTANSGDGGGGGAASVFIVNGVRAALAGGGGGGGGSLSILGGLVEDDGGAGGSGCRGNGQVATANGGGGGGGGACSGASTQGGSGRTPAFSSDIPSGRARGGSGNCAAGGAGYAIVTFSP